MTEVKIRDLLLIKAVRCHLSGTLVPFLRSCKGEGTRSGKPCGFYVSDLMCRYIRNMGIGVKDIRKVKVSDKDE